MVALAPAVNPVTVKRGSTNEYTNPPSSTATSLLPSGLDAMELQFLDPAVDCSIQVTP